jgi:acyl-CoA dehydrogenase
MISFECSEELLMVCKTAEAFGRDQIRPENRRAESAGAISPSLQAAYAELGFDLIDVKEEWGGLSQGLIGRTQVDEALAYADAGISMALSSFGSAHQLLTELASQAQQEYWTKRFLEEGAVISLAWSDQKPVPGKFSALAKQDEDGQWRLNGAKAFVLNGLRANYFLVFTQAQPWAGDETQQVFVVSADAEGVKKGPAEPSLGLEAAPFTQLTLENVRVADAQRLENSSDAQALIRALCRVSLLGAARQTGMASAAFDLARDYAEERTAFGKPIAHFQGLAFLIADMATTVEVMRRAVNRAAWAFDANEDSVIQHAVMAVAECHEGAMFVTNNAVQVFGGSGFIRDYPVEKWMRDAKAHMAYGIGRQLCDLIAGRLALKDTELSLAEDAPLPELQAIML